MEFWGVEVKVGQPIQVKPGFENIIHLSQACLAEVKKDNRKDLVHLYVNTDDKKLCIGTLSVDKCPQIGFDLVFDKEFQLSHTSKSGNVHFCGYKTTISDSYSDDTANTSLNEAKTGIATVGHTNKEVLEPSRQLNQDDDDSSDSFDSSDDEDTANAKKVSSEEDDSDDEDESDDNDESDDSDEDESDKEAGNKTTPGNKRENDSSVQTYVPAKKAKLVTPQKIDAKKSGGHVATPYPSKQVAKTSGKSDKSNQQSQKTGEFRCNPCSRTFGSENALQSHSKAKHGPK